MGEFEKASAALKGVVQSDPENLVAVRELGIAELNLKHFDEAINLFDKLTNLEKTEAMNYAWLGFALEAKKEYEKASQAWNKAATLFKEPSEIKKALEKVVRLEQKVGNRGIANEPEMKQLNNPLQQGD
jgi:tetratricopeptide (TPR) repeat protein